MQVSINGVVTHTEDNCLVGIAIWNNHFGGIRLLLYNFDHFERGTIANFLFGVIELQFLIIRFTF